MLYISPTEKSVGFAAGEAVTLKWKIYEDASKKIAYTMNSDDVITFVVRRGASPESEVIIAASGEAGSNEVVIPAEDTAWVKPGTYTALAVIRVPSRDIDELMIWPPIDEESEGVFPVGNCTIAAGGRGLLAEWQS